MDGPWQLGHRSAEDYAKLAAQTARAMRQLDGGIQLVVCGSSSRSMPTFGEWERTVLEHTWDEVDYISCHAYYSRGDRELGEYLASPVDMDRFIESVAATIDHVAAVKSSDKRIAISFDEWNVWDIERYHAVDKRTALDDWPVAPRLLEDSYTVADAVVVGGLLISLLRHADRVTAASLAQLVNVIAPIMTEPGGIAWRQTTFFPFAVTSRLARGRALHVALVSDSYDTAAHGAVPLVDAVATADDDGVSVFLVNRGATQPASVRLDLTATGVTRVEEAVGVWDADPMARNTLESPDRVGLRVLDAELVDGAVSLTLPPASWAAVRVVRS